MLPNMSEEHIRGQILTWAQFQSYSVGDTYSDYYYMDNFADLIYLQILYLF